MLSHFLLYLVLFLAYQTWPNATFGWQDRVGYVYPRISYPIG